MPICIRLKYLPALTCAHGDCDARIASTDMRVSRYQLAHLRGRTRGRAQGALPSRLLCSRLWVHCGRLWVHCG
eukprot:3829435-Rhodomonas_salina.2